MTNPLKTLSVIAGCALPIAAQATPVEEWTFYATTCLDGCTNPIAPVELADIVFTPGASANNVWIGCPFGVCDPSMNRADISGEFGMELFVGGNTVTFGSAPPYIQGFTGLTGSFDGSGDPSLKLSGWFGNGAQFDFAIFAADKPGNPNFFDVGADSSEVGPCAADTKCQGHGVWQMTSSQIADPVPEPSGAKLLLTALLALGTLRMACRHAHGVDGRDGGGG